MRWLYFLARLAFICNILFLLSLLFRMADIQVNQAITGFIIIGGMLMAPLLNLVFNVSFIIKYYTAKQPLGIPAWLIAFNIIVQVLQLIIIPFV